MGLLLQMDFSILYGGAQVHSASFPDTEGPGLCCASERPSQGGRDLHSSSCHRATANGRGARAAGYADPGAEHDAKERLQDATTFHNTSKLKQGSKRMLPVPQQKGPVTMKRGYRCVCQPSGTTLHG